MRKRTVSIVLGALACIFLAVLPATAEDSSASKDGNVFADLIEILVAWLSESDEASGLGTSTAPPDANLTTPDYPEVTPCMPPGG